MTKIDKNLLNKLILEEYKKSIDELYTSAMGDKTSGTIDTNVNKQNNTLGKLGQKYDDQRSNKQKQMFKQNALRQINLLTLLKQTIKQNKLSPQIEKMISHLKNEDTADYLDQVLKIKPTVSVYVNEILTNPMEVVYDIVDEVVKQARKNAQKELNISEETLNEMITESEKENLHLFHDEKDYAEKHDKKLKKKHQYSPPAPQIDNSPDKSKK